MSEYRLYRRTSLTEMRPVRPDETASSLWADGVSISGTDIDNGSPKPNDRIARNPKNHADQWLVTAEYFADNYEPFEES